MASEWRMLRFLACPPPQALELDPVGIVTEAAVPLTVKRISKRVVSSVSSFFNAKPCAAMLRAQSVRQQNNVYVFILLCWIPDSHYAMPLLYATSCHSV